MIEVAQQGRVAVVTMAHGKANAMDVELCEEIAVRFDELAPDAFALTKRQTRQGAADRIAADGPRHDGEVDRIWLTPEAAGRIRDYISRTFKKA